MAVSATGSVAAPIDSDIVRQASLWMARMWSSEVSDADKHACAQWRAQHPDHECAWQQLQIFETKLQSVPPVMARHALRELPVQRRVNRRQVLTLLGFGALAGGMAYKVRDTQAWRVAVADQSTGTGEIRELALPDGSQLVMDNASAVDIHFTAQERLVVLRAGAVRVTTAADPAAFYRPFRVQSRHGTVQALGTRLIVRQGQDQSHVGVYEGAVELRPLHAPQTGTRIDAGHSATFSADRVLETGAAGANDEAWTRGVLVADDMRVGNFVAELARYRSGWLRCDPAIADLKVSGVFSLRDTDRALHNLTLGLPVDVVYHSRYWVMVQARGAA